MSRVPRRNAGSDTASASVIRFPVWLSTPPHWEGRGTGTLVSKAKRLCPLAVLRIKSLPEVDVFSRDLCDAIQRYGLLFAFEQLRSMQQVAPGVAAHKAFQRRPV